MEFYVPLTDKDSTKAFPYHSAWCQGAVLRWEPLQEPRVWPVPQQLIADTNRAVACLFCIPDLDWSQGWSLQSWVSRYLRGLSMKELSWVFLTQSRLEREVCSQSVSDSSVREDIKNPWRWFKLTNQNRQWKKEWASEKRAALIAHHKTMLMLKQLQL